MKKRLLHSLVTLCSIALCVVSCSSCSIDRERKMYPSGGGPGGTVGIGGTVGGESESESGGSAGSDLGPDDDPPPNLDLGGANSLIDMAPFVVATDLEPAAPRDFGPEFLDL